MQKKSAAISDTKTYIDIRKHSRSPTDTWAAWTNRGQIHYLNAAMLEIITPNM